MFEKSNTKKIIYFYLLILRPSFIKYFYTIVIEFSCLQKKWPNLSNITQKYHKNMKKIQSGKIMFQNVQNIITMYKYIFIRTQLITNGTEILQQNNQQFNNKNFNVKRVRSPTLPPIDKTVMR